MADNFFGALSVLSTPNAKLRFFSLPVLGEHAGTSVERLPATVKILLENLVRRLGQPGVREQDVLDLAAWPNRPGGQIAFMPSRILMQDFTGVPAVVDLAALRSAVARAGGDPEEVNPALSVDLVVDHSVQVDRYGSANALRFNLELEYNRNLERYCLLNWAQHAFNRFRVVPPGMGICHQVNLEHLSRVVVAEDGIAFPETIAGTDSHTTMINGLGVLGWGVGGIEAEAAMLGQPMFLPPPEVLGIRLHGNLQPGATATDLVLTLTQMLRARGVVGKFVEFFGDGLDALTVADRATISNMSPEFGATAALFPVDGNSIDYLKETGRREAAGLVERYSKEQGLFRYGGAHPQFTEEIGLDLGTVEPSLAGPSRPQDRVPLAEVKRSFANALEGWTPQPPPVELGRLVAEGGHPAPGGLPSEETPPGSAQPAPQVPLDAEKTKNADGASNSVAEPLHHGSVVIAAITSCTNTSNPSVMIAAGLLARKAVEAGLETKPWVKTSLAPGSRVVTSYLEKAGLTPYLDKLGFNVVGYGCTTCIGNSGPLPKEVESKIETENLAVAAVLSGNRNFEGRIHPHVRASYLASPPLCVAYALAGELDRDLTTEPLGVDFNGKKVFLSDIWPSAGEVERVMLDSMAPEEFDREYERIFEGDEKWQTMPVPSGALYKWEESSTYVREPPYFDEPARAPDPPADIKAARVLVLLGDSVTTDHISPAGVIRLESPAGRYLSGKGVSPENFNSYGARRGNHEVMLRGTFGNIRLRNKLAPGTEGPWTIYLPGGDQMSIYDASLRYRQQAVPLLVIAGQEYGSGSSRDWAAKGTALLGVKAVIAQSFERIHRSNLVGMGVLPLQFEEGASAKSLGLSGREAYSIGGLANLGPGSRLEVTASDEEAEKRFDVTAKIESVQELDYFSSGGILNMVLQSFLSRD